MFSARPVVFAFMCLLALSAQAQQLQPQQSGTAPAGAALLERIQTSARQLDYAGVFAYQQGASMQSSRVTHLADAKGEHERLEILDGQPLEFLRNNDEIQCLIPPQRTILVEERKSRDRFPGLMLGNAEQLLQHYDVSVESEPERVADRDCNVVALRPKDEHRYGYRLCTDSSSGLLLRAQTLSAEDEVVEQVAFLALEIGPGVDRKQIKSRWKTRGWRVVRTHLSPVNLSTLGWAVGEPVGFQKMMEVQRTIGGKPDVKQVMLSDGLAAVSVFIEPYKEGSPQQAGPGTRGAIHVVGRRLGDHWITVLGEAPMGTIQQIADSVAYTPVAPRP